MITAGMVKWYDTLQKKYYSGISTIEFRNKLFYIHENYGTSTVDCRTTYTQKKHMCVQNECPLVITSC